MHMDVECSIMSMKRKKTKMETAWISTDRWWIKTWYIYTTEYCCCSVAKSCLTLWPPKLQHARLLCPSLSLWVCLNSCPLSQWCYLTISSSAAPFSSCPQSFPASGSFSMSQFFTLGGQSIGASASASVLPMNIQGWFPLVLTGLISLVSEGLSGVFSNSIVLWHPLAQFKSINSSHSAFFIVYLSHPYMTTGKTIAFLDGPLSAK